MKVLTIFLRPVGVVNMSFPLSDQPVFGEWFIFVEVQGHTYNKSFEVQKYGETQHIQETDSIVYQECSVELIAPQFFLVLFILVIC